MLYRFQCTECKCEEEKEKQTCSNCGAKMQRVIEWSGFAKGSGEGWFGKSDGSNAI